MSLPDWEIQQAVYTILSADTTLTDTLGVSVYDFVPDDEGFPLVAVGEDDSADRSSKTHSGFSTDIEIIALSNRGKDGAKGRDQVKTIMSRVHTLLHRQDLTLATMTHVLTHYLDDTSLLEPDGLTYRGVIRFRVMTHE